VDDRRTSIIDAVIPLLIEHGRSVTTRQIADAAGVAEGTIFRAFGDKDSLIEAAVERYLDPEPSNAIILGIDPSLPLVQKIEVILTQLQTRMTGIFGIMNAAGMSGPPPRRPQRQAFPELIEQVLRPDLEQLRVEPVLIGRVVRLIAFASAIPSFNEGNEITPADLASFITYGIAGIPAEQEESRAS
jgi:AcrR family transcriptional regulator